jgi:Transcriptional regulatory protein, C terminal
MLSQNKTLTKGQANIERYRQSCGYQADRQSAKTSGSSFSRPLAPTNPMTSITAESRTGKEVKVRAVHKRDGGRVVAARNPDTSDVLMYGDVTVSFSAMEVYSRGQLVALTRKEFNTLAYLLKNARRVISRDELLNEVWGYQSYPCTRTVDNHILRLRKKLEPEPALPKHFRTVHGMGYKFSP